MSAVTTPHPMRERAQLARGLLQQRSFELLLMLDELNQPSSAEANELFNILGAIATTVSSLEAVLRVGEFSDAKTVAAIESAEDLSQKISVLFN